MQLMQNPRAGTDLFSVGFPDVILEAVDERMDKKMDQKLDPVINKLDAILGEVQKHREENVSGAEQLRRHADQLEDHALRLKKLEVSART
jgi:hypothetical protein